jgi:hypothetical protein
MSRASIDLAVNRFVRSPKLDESPILSSVDRDFGRRLQQGQSLGETWIGGSCSYWAALPAISSMPGTHVANSTKQDAKNDGTFVIDRVLGD